MSDTRKKPVRGPSIKWTHDMRIALHLIISEFAIKGTRRADIFNAMFAQQLQACGLPNGASIGTLNIQYEMRKYPEKYKYWPLIQAAPATQEEADTREAVRARIRQVLQPTIPPAASAKSGPSNSQASSLDANGAPCKPIADSARVRHQRAQTPETETAPSAHSIASARPSVRKDLSKSSSSHAEGSNITTASTVFPETPPRSSAKTPRESTLAWHHATPPSSTNKRQASATMDLTGDDSDVEQVSTHLKRTRFTDSNKAPVPLFPVIKRREGLSQGLQQHSPKQVLRTPPRTKAVKKIGTPREKFLFSRPDGSQINTSKRREAATQLDLVPISTHIAEPPRPDLLFRYWEEQTPNNHNSRDGFTALKFFRCNVGHGRILKSQDIDFTDVFNHMNREMVKSRFVSTCNRLIWVVRLAMNEFKKGTMNGRISVIDPFVLEKHALLWARPFHDEITEKKIPWTNGAWGYRGSYEFLVQRSVPKRAILSTISVVDLAQLPQINPALGQLLRLEIIMNSASLHNKEAGLRRQAMPLDSRSAKAIAQVASFLGLTSDSPIAHVSHIVADIVQGWHLAVVHRETREWHTLASVFVRSFLGSSVQSAGFRQEQATKMTFLDGVRWGQGEFNARHKPETVAKMQRKATSIGLECPARIITDELDAVKIMLWSHENRIGNMLKRPNAQLMLEGGDASEDEGEAMSLGAESPTPGPSRPQWSWTRQLAMEDDDNDQIGMGDEYAFDDDGYVV